jgi:hypothetical protein
MNLLKSKMLWTNFLIWTCIKKLIDIDPNAKKFMHVHTRSTKGSSANF